MRLFRRDAELAFAASSADAKRLRRTDGLRPDACQFFDPYLAAEVAQPPEKSDFRQRRAIGLRA
jgi:hypothetical protein